jgi:hypothetical protein
MNRQLIHLTDADDWAPHYAKFEHLDVYYAKQYAELFARAEGGVAGAVYWENGSTRIFYPYIRRPVTLTDDGYHDLVTPYGYGGPHLEGDAAEIVPFYAAFGAWCREQRIITETVRLHPLNQNAGLLRPVMDVGCIRRTTAVDLTQSIEEIQRGYAASNLRNIKKAEKSGLHVIEGHAEEHLGHFVDLYYETMDRNRADDLYYFDRAYFEGQMQDTPLSRSRLLFVRHEGELIAGVLLLVGHRYAHYHLGASRSAALDLRPNNLLFHHMIRHARAAGAQWLHLGGGYQEDDGLMRFKSSFTNRNDFEYHIGKKIHDPVAYDRLTELALGSGAARPNYFPAYRAMRPSNPVEAPR